MTLAEIRATVYDRLQLSSAPPAAVATRLDRFVNRWNRKLLSGAMFRSFRLVQLTQASVADQYEYGIALEEIHAILDRTNDLRLVKRDLAWWRSHYPTPADLTGTPDVWVPAGSTRIQTRPSAACELCALSTAAGDITQVVRAKAIRTGGYPVSLSATLTGTNYVSLGSAYKDVVDILDVSMSAVATGTVTVRQDTGLGAVLSTIAIGQTSPRFLRYLLAPTPSAAITYYLDGLAPLVDLADTTDRSFIPDDFHDLLVDGAVYDEWLANGRTKDAQWLRDEIRSRILELRAWVWMQHIQEDPGDEPPRRFTDEPCSTEPIV